jgi:imidazolonepropionase-like amidohydrolase
MKHRLLIIAVLGPLLAVLLAGIRSAPPRHASPKELGHRPEKGLAITHVRLFEAETATIRAGQTVVIKDDCIEAVGPDQETKVTGALEVIDGTGKTLLPGLFDMHAHLQPSAGAPYLASGVTMVRDLGNQMDRLIALKRTWDSGEEIGPGILMAGPLNGSRGKGEPVSTEDEAQTAIDRFQRAGYVQIKILGNLNPALVPGIVKTAHARAMRVSGHVPEGMKADEFVRAGVDEIQHMEFVLKNFCRSGATSTDLEAEEGARLDIDAEPVMQWILSLKQKGIVIDPTLNVYKDKYGKRGGISRRYYQTMLRMLKRLFDEGVPLVVGSDGPRAPGAALHREMEIWVSAGIPAANVLAAATIGAARVMHLDAQTGSIRAGKKADLILVDGDPTQNIGDIRHCQIVIKRGTFYKCADLRP